MSMRVFANISVYEAGSLSSSVMEWSCIVLLLLVTRTGEAVSDPCLACLCEAASQCDLKFRCQNDVCGPFHMTRAYWMDGGSKGEGWEACAMDVQCAADTVRSYTKRYEKDCDGDGQVDCQDYARMHRMGGVGCAKEPGQDFYEFKNDIDTCLAEISASTQDTN